MEDDLTFPQIVNGLSAPIATTTADGRVDFANRQLLDYLGMSLETAQGVGDIRGLFILRTCPE